MNGSQRRILVVEDERTIAESVAARLRAEGFTVDLAHDGPSPQWVGPTGGAGPGVLIAVSAVGAVAAISLTWDRPGVGWLIAGVMAAIAIFAVTIWPCPLWTVLHCCAGWPRSHWWHS
jgi:hypothetical protein